MEITVFAQDPIVLVKDIVQKISLIHGSCNFVCGNEKHFIKSKNEKIHRVLGPAYNNNTIFKRVISWIKFSFFVCLYIFKKKYRNNDFFFFVSSPPFLGFFGFLAKKLYKINYAVLIYDIYPEIIIKKNYLHKNNIIFKIWNFVNCLFLKNASKVFTITEPMANLLKKKYKLKQVLVVPTWVDINTIRPIAKRKNKFILKNSLQKKTIVLYAGNFGNAANIEIIPEIAKKLKKDKKIIFLIAGKGQKKQKIKHLLSHYKLPNLRLIPFQSEKMLPFMLAAADISISILDKSMCNLAMPSKTAYYLAAGSSVLAICHKNDLLKKIICRNKCGFFARDANAAARCIKKMRNDPAKLIATKINSRALAANSFAKDKCVSNLVKLIEQKKGDKKYGIS